MDFAPDYSAALHGVAYQIVENSGLLLLEGRDQAAFLQRQTTNDVRLLHAGQTLLSVLTSATARILDVLTLFLDENGALNALTLPGRGAATFDFLKRRIFFNDQVKLRQAGAGWLHVHLLGPQAMTIAPALGLERLPAPGELGIGGMGGEPVLALPGAGPFGPGWRALISPGAQQAALSALQTAGGVLLEPHTAEILRIEAGIPGAGGELTEAHTPLEMLLEAAISASKGCYTGQEIIARQLTYDKVTQRLCGVRMAQPVQPGASVLAEGRSIGKITSAAVSPRFGPLALAVLRRPFFDVGTKVEIDGQTAEVIKPPSG